MVKKAKKPHYAWAILVACCAFSLGYGMVNNCVGQYYIPITRDLNFSMGEFLLQSTIRGFVAAAATTMLDKALEKIDLRVLLSGSYIIQLACFALMSTFTKLWHFFACNVALAVFIPTTNLFVATIILNRWFIKKRGFATGIAMTFSGVGGIIMNPVLAWIINGYGWRTAYIANAILAAVVILPFTVFVMRLQPSDKGLKPYGYEETDVTDSNAERQAPSDAADTLKGVARSDAFHSRTFLLMLLLFAALGLLGGFPQQLSPFGITLGLSITVAAILPSLSMVGNVLLKLGEGAINDKFGAKAMMYTGLTVTLIAMILLQNGGSSMFGLMTGALLSGMFLSVMSVGLPLLTQAVFGSRDYIAIFVKLSLVQTLFLYLGSPVVGFIYDYTGGYEFAFIIGAIITVGLFIITYFIFRTAKKLVRR